MRVVTTSRIAAILVIMSLAIGMIPAVSSVATSAIRIGQIKHATAADFAWGTMDGIAISPTGDGELTLASGREQGTFTSPILQTEFAFNAVGVDWNDDHPALAQLEVELRLSRDGKEWQDWRTIADGDIPSKYDKHSSDLFLLVGRYVQYRVTLTTGEEGQSPTLADIAIKYIDSTAGPDLGQARASAASLLGPTPAGQPFIIPRAAWNVQEPYSSVNWPPEYATTRTAVVHHTDTPSDSDPAAAVRAIWYDHAVLKGWGDIGYNYLVDQFGTIYEGRFGGDNVIGAHVGYPYNAGSLGVALIGTYVSIPPSYQGLSSLRDLLAWKSNWHNIDPTASVSFYDRYVNAIMGHRDVGMTECPGGSLYGLLPGVRSLTKSKEGWGQHTTPQRMAPGQTVWVGVEVQNLGTQTWYPGGGNPFDLGYHWYTLDGKQYVQPSQDDHRASVPWPLAYDQRATINILLTAPTTPGTYRLEWDMVQEYVSWFKTYGNLPLVATVVVAEPSPPTATATRTSTPIPTSTPTPTATPTPALPTLKVDPPSASLLMGPGLPPRPWVFRIQNAGGGSFSWQAIPFSSGGWLKLEPASGGQPGSLTVSVDQVALGEAPSAPALLEGSISISASPGTLGSPQTIPVRLYVSDHIYFAYIPVAQQGYVGGW